MHLRHGGSLSIVGVCLSQMLGSMAGAAPDLMSINSTPVKKFDFKTTVFVAAQTEKVNSVGNSTEGTKPSTNKDDGAFEKHMNAAIELFNNTKYELAIAEFQQALETDPNNVVVLNWIGF